ncbi:amidohydrolase family protein [Corynebacterium frankenforstense]|uniref:amidohydrolase family protein n=1 Tax=Corynebacterium frankenforstense TaxID=1230998 RepID=UPI0009523B89|nr:amidohydrolase family protein [Corynebacterium frankenforstense]
MQHDRALDAIDTHAHVYPDDYLDYLGAHGAPEGSTEIAKGMGADSGAEDMKARLEWMDRAGVEAQVLAVTPQSPALPEAEHAAYAARMINERYIDIAEAYPGRFHCYAALPLPHLDAALEELEWIDDSGRFCGVGLPALSAGRPYLSEGYLDPVWSFLDEREMVVNIHPTGCGANSQWLLDHRLEWVNGAPVEDATATLELLKADVPRRFPKITFHVAHLGGDLPMLAQRIEDNYEDWDAFPASPNETLRRFYFDAANFHEPSLALAAETFGLTQLIAGSDFPYFQREKYVRAFDYVRTSRFSDEEKQQILRKNAERLFKLGERTGESHGEKCTRESHGEKDKC